MPQLHMRQGFTLIELLVILASVVLLLSVVLPSMARTNGESETDVSMSNLINLGVSHVIYAAEWEGRQVTMTRDDLGDFGTVCQYQVQTGDEHPWIALGWTEGTLWGFPLNCGFPGNAVLSYPFSFTPRIGNFRLPAAKTFHDYVGGRYYDPVFFAPADSVAYETVAPNFDNPDEWVLLPGPGWGYWSSYSFSPAAMYDPMVMRPLSQGGWQNPVGLEGSTVSPGLFTATYPDLKTQIIENHWNQNPPSKCNPDFKDGIYAGCEPWYFNHGIDSSPVSLFYDLSVRQLPNAEVYKSDQQVLNDTGGVDGPWSRDTQPHGPEGYFLEASFDDTPLSHHVLTTSGIQGRDTLGP